MADAVPLAAAVLCGGGARRMGRDKATLAFDGVMLLDRALERLRAIAHPLLIAAGEAGVQRPGCVTVRDAQPNRGPLGAIAGALGAATREWCAIVAVDMPNIDTALLRSLSRLCATVDAVVPVSERGPEPLHALYGRSALPALGRVLHGSDVSMVAALAALRVRYVDARRLGAAHDFAFNLNCPGDVRAWLESRAPGG